MHNRIQSRLELWWRYGYTKDDLAACRSDIVGHNARSLGISSLLAGIVIIVLSLYPSRDTDIFYHRNFVPYLLAAALEFIICITINIMRRHVKLLPTAVDALVISSFLVILLIANYILSRDIDLWSERFILFFIVFQIIFVYDFTWVITANAIALLLIGISEGVFASGHNLFWYFDLINIICAVIITLIFTRVSSHRVLSEMISTRSLEVERNRFHEESIRDQLTGLGNRRNYEQSVDFYTSVCRHVHQTVCIIMLDVDFFKAYNDLYGHPKGDEVLKSIGRVLKDLSETERVFAARVGGEEFIVLWTENRIAEAERVALKLRQSIIDLKIPHEKSTATPYVTASIGLYVMRGGSQDTSTQLYKNADMALYRAKEQGRDRIVLHDSASGVFREVALVPPELIAGRR